MPAPTPPAAAHSAASREPAGTMDWRDQRIAELEARVARLEQQLADAAGHLAEIAIPDDLLPSLAPDAEVAVHWDRPVHTSVEPKAVVD